jgi:hypothetical protein
MPTPEEKIAQFAPSWAWAIRHCPATDPFVEYAIEQGDPALRGPLIAAHLETTAATYRAIADGAAKAAQIVAGKTRG